MEAFLISFLASLAAVLVALFIDRLRMPKLILTTSEDSNSDTTYPPSHPRAGQRWKFYRILVKNKPFPKYLSLIPRQTAENCRGRVEFIKKDETIPIFSLLGRWASTPEIPHIPHEAIVKIYHPDPVTIPVGEKEILDVIVKADGDVNAYGWNNESYFHNWRNPDHMLDEGEYIVKIKISTQNGISFEKKFNLAIRKNIVNTILMEKR